MPSLPFSVLVSRVAGELKVSTTRSTELQDSEDTAAELKQTRRTGKLNLSALKFNVANGFHNK